MESTRSVWPPSDRELPRVRRWKHQSHSEGCRENQSAGRGRRFKSGECGSSLGAFAFKSLTASSCLSASILLFCTQPHRVSVRSVTANRRTSRDAACTMIIGRDVSHLGPTNVKATNITCSSAVISWLPANSNHQHVVCVNNVEVRTLKPGVYRHTITGN
jgi:hypothetical protein